MRQRIAPEWSRWGHWLMALLFIAAHFTLMSLKHGSFHTNAFDLGKFDQAIWNTLHGRFLYSSLESKSILADHFSPIIALVSPFYLIWNDVHVFFLLQAIGLAVTGVFLRRIIEAKHPQVANWFLVAFYLNPALHEVALVEAHRATLAVPFLAWAMHALYTGRRKPMAIALLLAMLCKENMGIVAFMVGVYLCTFRRDWRWGLPVALFGASWLVVVSLWLIPAFAQKVEGAALYPQLRVLCLEGGSYGEILTNVVRHPGALLGRVFDREALLALLRIAIPVGLVLPFLASDWLLMVVPSLIYMLASCVGSMHRLENWYMAEVLPGLFASVAVGLTRLSKRRAGWVIGWLLLGTLAGYALYSKAPLGGTYEPQLYQVTDHSRLAARVVEAIPADAIVAAQDSYVPHLTHREHIYMFPWMALGPEGMDYFLLDRKASPYPVERSEMDAMIDNLLTIPQLVVEREGDGIYLLHQGGAPLPSFPVGVDYEGTLRLERVEVAELGDDGFFHPLAETPIRALPRQTLRVTLYWKALGQPSLSWTVSLRIADSQGPLLVQSDHIPGSAAKPTSIWQEGWQVRDVHYLVMPGDLSPARRTLDVVLYNAETGTVVPTQAGADILHVIEVEPAP